MLNISHPDLIRSLARYRPDGSPVDPYAHHRHEIEALRRAERRARWSALVQGLRARLHLKRSPVAPTGHCPPGAASCP